MLSWKIHYAKKLLRKWKKGEEDLDSNEGALIQLTNLNSTMLTKNRGSHSSQFFDFSWTPTKNKICGSEQLDACTHWPNGVKTKNHRLSRSPIWSRRMGSAQLVTLSFSPKFRELQMHNSLNLSFPCFKHGKIWTINFLGGLRQKVLFIVLEERLRSSIL